MGGGRVNTPFMTLIGALYVELHPFIIQIVDVTVVLVTLVGASSVERILIYFASVRQL